MRRGWWGFAGGAGRADVVVVAVDLGLGVEVFWVEGSFRSSCTTALEAFNADFGATMPCAFPIPAFICLPPIPVEVVLSGDIPIPIPNPNVLSFLSLPPCILGCCPWFWTGPEANVENVLVEAREEVVPEKENEYPGVAREGEKRF